MIGCILISIMIFVGVPAVLILIALIAPVLWFLLKIVIVLLPVWSLAYLLMSMIQIFFLYASVNRMNLHSFMIEAYDLVLPDFRWTYDENEVVKASHHKTAQILTLLAGIFVCYVIVTGMHPALAEMIGHTSFGSVDSALMAFNSEVNGIEGPRFDEISPGWQFAILLVVSTGLVPLMWRTMRFKDWYEPALCRKARKTIDLMNSWKQIEYLQKKVGDFYQEVELSQGLMNRLHIDSGILHVYRLTGYLQRIRHENPPENWSEGQWKEISRIISMERLNIQTLRRELQQLETLYDTVVKNEGNIRHITSSLQITLTRDFAQEAKSLLRHCCDGTERTSDPDFAGIQKKLERIESESKEVVRELLKAVKEVEALTVLLEETKKDVWESQLSMLMEQFEKLQQEANPVRLFEPLSKMDWVRFHDLVQDVQEQCTRLRDLSKQKKAAAETFYDHLGVKPDATEDEIREQLKKKKRIWRVMQTHSDKDKRRYAEDRIDDIPKMERTLLNPEARKKYDQKHL